MILLSLIDPPGPNGSTSFVFYFLSALGVVCMAFAADFYRQGGPLALGVRENGCLYSSRAQCIFSMNLILADSPNAPTIPQRQAHCA